MAAGKTLTLTTGSDYIFGKAEVWTGIIGNGTRGVTLQTMGNTLYVSRLDHITGGINPPGSAMKDTIVLQPHNGGNTVSVRLVETVYGASGGNDVLRVATTGSTMAVENVETFLGATSGTNLIVLTRPGNTMSVGYLKSIIGSAGRDEITFGAAGEGGTTAVITMVERVVGTTGSEDMLATVAGGSNTVTLKNIEVFLGNGSKPGDVLTLEGGGTIGVAYIETLIGSTATDDVMSYAFKIGTADIKTGGGTVAVSSIETIVGGTSFKNAAVLLDVGNTITVSSLNTLLGNTGNDVIKMTMRDGTPIIGTMPVPWNTVGNTMNVSMIETIIGSSGNDALVALNNENATMRISSIETLVGRQGIETVFLSSGGGNTLFIEGLETLVGSTGKDVIGVTPGGSIRGMTLSVSSVETLMGGAGTDVAMFRESSGTVLVSGIETVYFGTTGQSLELGGVERLVVFPITASAPSAPVLSTGSDTGVLGDSKTSATLPTLTGTSAAGSLVNLYGNDTALGSGTANGSGQWSITANTALSDGVWTLTAKSVSSGMESSASNALLLTVDATAPAAPAISYTPGSDSGRLSDDGYTNVTTPTVTGTAEAGSTVTLYLDGASVGMTTASGVGAWSITTPVVPQGGHTLTARAVDAAGNTSVASNGLMLTLDTVVAAPTGVALAAGSNNDTGTPGDNLTAVNTPAISGTAEANSVVSLYEGASLLGNATANGSGVWQITLGALAEGAHTLTASAVDLAGNSSTASASFTLTIDTTPPVAPSAPSLTEASDSGVSSSDRLTNVRTPTFTGTASTAEAGSVVQLLVSGGIVGSTTLDNSGTWTITTDTLAQGSQSVSVRIADAAGNTRDGVASLTVTIDTTAGTVGGIKLSAATDTGSSAIDGVTNNTAPTVTGTAEAGSVVTLYNGASTLGTATVNGQGNWEITTSGLTVGAQTLTASAVDAAGNTSGLSTFTVTVDTSASAPTGLALALASNTGDTTDSTTKLTTPSITGTAEAFSTVLLYEGSTLLGQATADSNRAWTVTSSALTGGQHILTARAIDQAGNTSADSTVTINIDLVAPGAPVALTLYSGSDSGTTGDHRTKETTPTITGTAEPGSTVALYDGNTEIGTGTANASSGAFSILTNRLSDGTHTLTARAVDTAGNTGAASASLSITIDTAAAKPSGFALSPDSDTGGSNSDGNTKDDTPTVTGSAEAGAVVTLYEGLTDLGSTLGSATADSSGRWSITPTSVLTTGEHTLTAKALDVAGNISDQSTELFVVTIDTSPPVLVGLGKDDNDSNPLITGTTDAGAFVTLYDSPSGNVLGTTTANGSGDWSIRTPNIAQTAYTFEVVAADLAGNTTSATMDVGTIGFAGIPTGLTLVSDSDSGTPGDRLTNVTQPMVRGAGQTGDTITLQDGAGIVLGTTTVANGAWTITAGSMLAGGVHTLTAVATNGGTVIGTSSGLTITIDTTAPSAPFGLVVQEASTGLSATDWITNLFNPVITGTAEARSVVTLYDSNGTSVVGTATSSDSGVWSVTTTLTAGVHTLTAKAVDVAGNTGTASTPGGLTVTVDTTADTPTIQTLADDRGTSGSHITNMLAPTLTGSAEAGSTVSLYKGSNLVGAGTANAQGAWTVTTSALGDGTHSLTAQLVDVAGNISSVSPSFSLTVDTSAPDAPGLLAISSDTGTLGDRITKEPVQTITGTAEPGGTVVLYDGVTALGTVIAGTLGAWSIASTLSTSTLAAGSNHTLTARTTDLAGNTGAASAALTVTIDTATPDPSGIGLTAASNTGWSTTNIRTRTQSLSLIGSAEANSTVTLYDNGSGTPLGTATADGTGSWSFTTATLTEGAHTLTASGVDLAGNSSSGTGSLTVTVDLSLAPPGAPALATVSDTGVSSSDNRTRLLAPTITGTVEANAQVSLYDSGAFVGMTTAGTAGVWQITRALAEGAHTLTTQVVDPAGNSAASTGSLVITIDATAPDAPAGVTLAPASDSATPDDHLTSVTTPTLSGTAEAGSTVTLYSGTVAEPTATVGATTVGTLGVWTITAASLADGIHTLTVRAVDSADNTSSASTALLVTVDTTTPAPSGLGLSTATDSGRSFSDGFTRIVAPTITGTAEAGSVVTVTDAGTLLGVSTTNSNGLWSISTPTLAEGAHTLTVVAEDGAGNTATASDVYTLTVDLTVAAPTGLTLASDSGVDGADRLTNVTTPAISGTAEAFAAVQLYKGTTLLGTGTADESGNWTVTSASLGQGSHSLTAAAIDLAGNSSIASAALTITIDTASEAPDPVRLSETSDTGIFSNDGLTRLAMPDIVGTAEARSVVTLYENGAAIGTGTADTLGAFTITSTATLGAGDHSLTVQSVDRAGNTSLASSPLTITVDLSTMQPTIQMNTGSDTGISNTDRITASTQPQMVGTAEALSRVTLYANGQAVGTADANTLGAWAITPTSLTAANYTMTAVAVDQAGNTSTTLVGLTVTVDTLAEVPSLGLSTATNSGSTSDATTNDITPDLTGTVEAGAVVTLYEGATVRGSTTADNAGKWTITSAQLGNGEHTLTATSTDVAGNRSVLTAGFVVTIDMVAPSAATGVALAAGSDSGNSTTDRITKVATPSLSGTAEANSTITLFDGSTAVGTAVASNTGAWTVTSGATLTHGQHGLSVTVTDVAGNTGAASSPLSLSIDTTPPTLSALSFTAATDTGSSSTDGITRNVTPTVTGTVEANSTVTIYDGGTAIGTATANGLGIWSKATSTLTAGAHTLTAIAVDQAGNTSAASADFTVTIDITATKPDGLALAVDSGSWATDRLINNNTPTITGTVGTAEAGGVVELYRGAVLVGSGGTVGADGTFTVTSAGLVNGTHELTAKLVDVAGNTSDTSSALSITVDTTAPSAPGTLALGSPFATSSSGERITRSTNPVVTGTAEVGSTVMLFEGSTNLGSTTVGVDGSWTITSTPLTGSASGTAHSLLAVSVDAAGNTSVASSALTIMVDNGGVTPTLALSPSFDTGAQGDGTTSWENPAIVGTAEAGSVVTLYGNWPAEGNLTGTATLGSATADSTGVWSIRTPTLSGGTALAGIGYTVSAVMMDLAGNTATSGTYTLTIDVTPDPVSIDLSVASDGAVRDRVTSQTSPTLEGKAGGNKQVVISEGGSVLGTVTSEANGAWSFAPTLTAGVHTILVTSQDSADNTASSSFTLTIDTTSDAPGALVLAAGSDSGRITNDRLTNVLRPTVQGTAEAGSTVTIYDGYGSTSLGTATANSSGGWSFTTPTELSVGLHTLTAAAIDVSGNSQSGRASLVIEIATTALAPGLPTLTSASNSGTTRFTTPTFTGTAQPNDVVMLYDGNGLSAPIVGIATADGSGNWSIQSTGVSEGGHTLVARRVDLVGNTSAASASLTVTIDTIAPGSPTLALPASSDSGTRKDDRLTNALTPMIIGSADADSTVMLYEGATALGTVVADGSGFWTVTALSGLTEGDYTLTARAVDEAGNSSSASAALTVTIDRTSTTPTGLVLGTGSDSGSSAADRITSVTTPTIVGAAEANSVVTLTDGATDLGTVTADGAGAWAIVAGTALADGLHTLTATAVDYAGNISSSSVALTVNIDTTKVTPTGLALSSGSDTGQLTNTPTLSDRKTNVTTPTITGSAEANSVVSLYEGTALLGLTTADGLGAWTFTPSGLSEGDHILTAQSVDVAGNTSAMSGGLSLSIDTTIGTPLLIMASSSDTGASAEDLNTQTTTPTFFGTAEKFSIITLYDDAVVKGTTTADAQGAWTVTSTSLSQGTRQISVQAVDMAGNTATTNQIFVNRIDGEGNTVLAVSDLSLTIDTVGPGAPFSLMLSDDSDSGTVGNRITNVSSLAVTGTAEANAHIRLYEGTTKVGETYAGDDGVWSSSTSSLAVGVHTLTAMAEDAAGNTSFTSGPLTLTITPVLAAPSVTLAASSDTGTLGDDITSNQTPMLTGTTLASSVVKLYSGTAVVGSTTANSNGVWSVTTSTLSAGTRILRAIATDSDGVDSPVTSFNLTIDTTAPTLTAQTPVQNGTNVALSSSLTLTFAETVSRGTGNLLLKKASDNSVVATIPVADTAKLQIFGNTVTVNPGVSLAYSTGYYLEAPVGAFIDAAGNAFAGLGISGGLAEFAFTTEAAPPSPPPPPPPPPVVSSTVDGVTVQQQSTTNPDGTVSQTVVIPVVTASRTEQVGNNTVADIPLVAGTGGQNLLTAQVPTGVGLQVSGLTTPKSAGTSVTDLIREIQGRTTAGSADQNQLTGGGSSFLAALPTSTPLLVQTIVPTVAAGATAPTQRLVISGTPTPNPQAVTNGAPMTALVIDTRSLPSGSEIELENVDFAAVIGAVRVTGGDGSQNVFGDGADQYIVLGADDDTLHGGGGNDYVGSRTGNDVLYGNEGADTVTGGEDADIVYGNQQNDALYGNQGSDTLFGGQDLDTLFGGQDGDIAYGNKADDVIYGNKGEDTLFGGQAADTMFGGQGNDWLFGNRGDDALFGNLGDDVLTGGEGADSFVFASGGGADIVTDFSFADGDRLITGGRRWTVRDGGSGAVVTFDGGETVTLRNLKAVDVTAAFFRDA